MLSALKKFRKVSYMALLAGIVAIGLLGQQADLSHLHLILSQTESAGQTDPEIPVSETQTDPDLFHTGRYMNTGIRTQIRKSNHNLAALLQQIAVPFLQNKFVADHLPIPRPGYYRFLFRYTLF